MTQVLKISAARPNRRTVVISAMMSILVNEGTIRYRKFEIIMSEMMAVRGYENGDYRLKVLKRRQGNGFSPLDGGMELFR